MAARRFISSFGVFSGVTADGGHRQQRALGAAVLASVVSIALMELTSEYLTFTSVSQEFWMLVGLGAAAAAQSRPSPMPFLVLKGGARRRGGRRQPV